MERRGGRLMVEGVSAESLARRYGTPLYAYSGKAVLSRYRSLEKEIGRASCRERV